jgi:hypothetical protein
MPLLLGGRFFGGRLALLKDCESEFCNAEAICPILAPYRFLDELTFFDKMPVWN